MKINLFTQTNHTFAATIATTTQSVFNPPSESLIVGLSIEDLADAAGGSTADCW